MRKTVSIVARVLLALMLLATLTGHILFIFFSEKNFVYAVPQNFFAGFMTVSVSVVFTYTNLYPVFAPIALLFVSALFLLQIFSFRRRLRRLTVAAAILTWLLLIGDVILLFSMFRNGWGGWQLAADLVTAVCSVAVFVHDRIRRREECVDGTSH